MAEERPRWPRLVGRHEIGLAIAIVAVLAAATFLDRSHSYLHNPHASAVQILRQTAFLGIFATGAAIVIIAGGIDLSSGAVIAFSASMCATFIMVLDPAPFVDLEAQFQWWVTPTAIAGTLVVGLLVGTLHAWLINGVGLPPFVATLATLVGLRSLARAIIEFTTEHLQGSRSSTITVYDPNLRVLSRYLIEGWPVIPMVLFVVVVITASILMGRTVIGRHLYALGGNEAAARLSGVRTETMKWIAYTLAAMLSTVAGILYLSDDGAANPETMGRAYELNAIAAAVVGGCSLRGGVGTMFGTALGALFLSTVIDGVARIIKHNADLYEGVIVGIVVVLAVALNQSTGTRKLFVGWLGLAAIVNLSLLAGVLTMLLLQEQDGMSSSRLGLGVGLTLAVLLTITRQWEYRRRG